MNPNHDPQSLVANLLSSYEQGAVTRRQFVEAVSILAATAALAPSALAAEPPAPIVPVSINHVAIGCSDVKRSTEWYCRIFKLKIIQQNDHYALLQFGNTQLVLRSPTKGRSDVPGTISHVMFGVSPYDEPAMLDNLKAQGLTPHKDLASFLFRDPDNLLVQVGDERLGIDIGYPPSST
jgi:catechol 2,3-dioxygenase-like lactoylglutathione lyase family enzyme